MSLPVSPATHPEIIPISTELPQHGTPNAANTGKKKKKNRRKNKAGSSLTVAKPFPKFNELPESIQKRIFEWSFYQDSNHTIGPTLALVCRRANEWIEPLIYKYILIDRFDRISPRPDRLWRTFSESSKSTEFFKNHVKGILVNGSVDPVVTDLLSICTNIDTFACYPQGPLPDTILEKLASIFSTGEFPKLRRLFVSGLGFEAEDIHRPFFQNLTHLAIDIGDNYTSFPWQELKTHSRLTHILIDMHLDLHEHAPQEFKSAILDILENAPQTLRCLVILFDWEKLYESSFQQKCDRGTFADAINGKLDERVIVAAYTGEREEIDVTVVGEDPAQFLEYVGFVALAPHDTLPWVCKPDGVQRDIWERADEVVRQRRQ